MGEMGGLRVEKKNWDLFCGYADMKAFGESQWEVRKTDLRTPPFVSHAVAISSTTQRHEGAGTHREPRFSGTMITRRKCGVHTGDVH